MPRNEREHLRKVVGSVRKIVKRPVLDYQVAEAEPERKPPTQPER